MEDHRDHASDEEQEPMALSLRLRLLQREYGEMETVQRGFVSDIHRLEAEVQDLHRRGAHTAEAQRTLHDQQALALQHDLQTRLQAAETENRHLRADAEALWDARYAQAQDTVRRLQREVEVAQAVAKLGPQAVARTTEPESTAAPFAAGQREMLGLLRELVGLVRGDMGAPPAPLPQEDGPATAVHFPPEPLWPDAFRQSEWRQEDYARELGQEEPA